MQLLETTAGQRDILCRMLWRLAGVKERVVAVVVGSASTLPCCVLREPAIFFVFCDGTRDVTLRACQVMGISRTLTLRTRCLVEISWSSNLLDMVDDVVE